MRYPLRISRSKDIRLLRWNEVRSTIEVNVLQGELEYGTFQQTWPSLKLTQLTSSSFMTFHHIYSLTVQYSCVQYIYGTRGGCDPPAAFPRKCRKTQVPNIRELFVCWQVVAPLPCHHIYSTVQLCTVYIRYVGRV